MNKIFIWNKISNGINYQIITKCEIIQFVQTNDRKYDRKT